ncbi:hypothetical protein Gohar_026905, partial [Gossypium harknessii]|nr:hypothetical protein [Gossypium harknessii]
RKTGEKEKLRLRSLQNEDDSLVSFSKRCTGIYKKISELSTLCGAEILFIIFSPNGKPYSFGHPTLESVARQFLNPNHPLNETTHALVEAYLKLVMDLIEILDKKVDSYLTVSLNKSMTGFNKSLLALRDREQVDKLCETFFSFVELPPVKLINGSFPPMMRFCSMSLSGQRNLHC